MTKSHMIKVDTKWIKGPVSSTCDYFSRVAAAAERNDDIIKYITCDLTSFYTTVQCVSDTHPVSVQVCIFLCICCAQAAFPPFLCSSLRLACRSLVFR